MLYIAQWTQWEWGSREEYVKPQAHSRCLIKWDK